MIVLLELVQLAYKFMKLFDLSNSKGSIVRYFLFFSVFGIVFAGTFPEDPGKKDDFHFFYSNEPSTKYDSIANYDDFQTRVTYHPVDHFAFDFWFIENSLNRARDLALGLRYELPFSAFLKSKAVPNLGFVWNDFIGGHKHYRSKLFYFKWESEDLSFLIGHGKGQVWNKLLLRTELTLPFYFNSQIDFFDNQLSTLLSTEYFKNEYTGIEPSLGYNFKKEQLILRVSSSINAETWELKTPVSQDTIPIQLLVEPEWKNALGTEFGELESQLNLNSHLILDYFINLHGVLSAPIYKSNEFQTGGVYEPHIVSKTAVSYVMLSKMHEIKKISFKYGIGNTFYDRTTLAFKSSYSNDYFDLNTLYIKYLNYNNDHLTQQVIYKPTTQLKIGLELGHWSYGDLGGILFINKNFNYFDIQPELGYSETEREKGVYFMAIQLNFKLDLNYSNSLIKLGLHPNVEHKQSTSLLLEGKSGTRNFIRPNRLKSLNYF